MRLNVTSPVLSSVAVSTVSSNHTATASDLEEGDDTFYLYILPAIVAFGLTGNIISLVTIFHSRLRHVSANMYLIVLTAADSVFLFGILLITFKVDYISFEYCVALEYVLMVSSYVSAWGTAALTIERYWAIAHPLKHVRYGHVDRSKKMLYWLWIPFVLHLFQFVNLVPNTPSDDTSIVEDTRKCMLREANYQVYSEFLDMLLCFGIPCMVVVVLNLLVAAKVNRQRKFMEGQNQTRESRRQGGGQNGGLTRILWVVPMVFVILNTPFFIVRLIEAFSKFAFGQEHTVDNYTETEKTLYNTAHYLYYLNFACDVVVYAFSSANFRKTAVIAWRRIFCPGYAKKNAKMIQSHTSRSSVVDKSRPSSQRRSAAQLETKTKDWSKLDQMEPTQIYRSTSDYSRKNKGQGTAALLNLVPPSNGSPVRSARLLSVHDAQRATPC